MATIVSKLRKLSLPPPEGRGRAMVARQLKVTTAQVSTWLSRGVVPNNWVPAVTKLIRDHDAAVAREKARATKRARKKIRAGVRAGKAPATMPATAPRPAVTWTRGLLNQLIIRLGIDEVARRARRTTRTVRDWKARPTLSKDIRDVVLKIERDRVNAMRAVERREQLKRFRKERAIRGAIARAETEVQRVLSTENRIAVEMTDEFNKPRPVAFTYNPKMYRKVGRRLVPDNRLLTPEELLLKASLPSQPFGEPLDQSAAQPTKLPVRPFEREQRELKKQELKKQERDLPKLKKPRIVWPTPSGDVRKGHRKGFLNKVDLPHRESVPLGNGEFIVREIKFAAGERISSRTFSYDHSPLFGRLIEEITPDGNMSEAIRQLALMIVDWRNVEDPTQRAAIAVFIEVHRWIPNSPGYYDEHGQVIESYKNKIGTWVVEPHGNVRLASTLDDLAGALSQQLGEVWFKSLGRYLVLQALRVRIGVPIAKQAA